MSTITYTPHPDLDKIDPEFRAKWAEALMTSVQHKSYLCNDSLESYCCLGVALIVDGADIKKLENDALDDDSVYAVSLSKREYPSEIAGYFKGANSLELEGLSAASDSDGDTFRFSDLNDEHLTHPQIAALLRGESVTIEVES